MSKPGQVWTAALCAALLWCPPAGGALGAPVQEAPERFPSPSRQRLTATIEFMASLGSRVAGYPGAGRAADYVEQQFAAAGLQDIRREEFDLTVPVEVRSQMRLVETGEELELAGLWPNLVRTTTIAPPGVSAHLVYGGGGEYADFNGADLDGAVVLMDFNSWHHWVRAVSLGARAVVFVAPEETSYRQTIDKLAFTPLDVPRFWIARDPGQRLRRRLLSGESIHVLLDSRMDWRREPGWNIWGTFEGTDPDLRDDVIVVEAYYDGISIAPAVAPAAEQASSIAALLELAHHLKENPPGRTVLLLAAGGHFMSFSGVVDFLDRHARKHKTYKARTDSLDPRLFIGLDLSTKTDQVGIWNNTGSFDLKRFFVPFGRRFTTYAEEVAPGLGRSAEKALVNGISPIRGMDWSTFVPDGVSVDAMVAMEAGQVALSFVTIHDARFPVNTPLDTPERMRLDNLDRQVAFLNGILSKSFDDPELFVDLEDFGPVLTDNLRTHKVRVRAFPRRSQIPDRKIRDAIVSVGWGMHKGVHWTKYAMADEQGDVDVPGLFVGGIEVAAFVLDQESGDVTYAPDLSQRAQKFHGKPLGSGRLTHSVRWTTATKTVVVFPCIPRTIYGLVHPNLLFPIGDMKIIDRGGVAPRQYGFNIDFMAEAAVIFAPREARDDSLKLLMKGMLLINSPGGDTEEQARGTGYGMATADLVPTEYLAARDMWRLNDARLKTMRRHAIENQRLTRLHEAGRRHLEAATAAMESRQWEEYIAEIRAALGVTLKAYPDVVGTLNDVIRGIVFFLALVIPAAFFGERLLFASPDIRMQLAGFGGLLLAIWMVISQVHPAFAIAHPLIILLGFSIMAMACFVLAMVMARFNRYIKEYQAAQAMVHQTDISRISAAYTAFMLGISNMRRRKLRTGLTLLTLTLLTFTVLSFTSFKADVRFLVFPLPHDGAYEGVLIRDRGWNPVGQTTLEFARLHFGGEAIVAPRSWYIAYDDEDKKYTEVKRDTLSVRSTGLVGLSSLEPDVTGVDACLTSGRFFEADDEAACILSTEMAADLGIDSTMVGGTQVQVFGKQFLVRGLFDPEAFGRVRDLDNEPLTPVDFIMSSTQALGPMAGPQMAVVEEVQGFEVKPFVHLPPENVVILPAETLREAFGGVRSVGIRFHPGAPSRDLVEDFLVRVAGTLFAGFREPGEERVSVSSYTSIGITAVEGMGALIIPMVIAALIVLNAMLGAVYERFREIDIYSSVGLAPMHIALLFIAEACVYAVIGVTLGYVVGQGLGKILVHLGWLRGMNLNYSSMSAIVSAGMVMVVVLLSTIYPARVAARSAVPDTVRRWQPPPPGGRPVDLRLSLHGQPGRGAGSVWLPVQLLQRVQRGVHRHLLRRQGPHRHGRGTPGKGVRRAAPHLAGALRHGSESVPAARADSVRHPRGLCGGGVHPPHQRPGHVLATCQPPIHERAPQGIPALAHHGR
ncbi:FtsX-like permease family protein [Candidatus Latescibacterota bacterium]